VKLDKPQLDNLKKGTNAVCKKCNNFYHCSPPWVIGKLILILVIPVLMVFIHSKMVIILLAILELILVALFHELQGFLPLSRGRVSEE
jgi:hypothetical protein